MSDERKDDEGTAQIEAEDQTIDMNKSVDSPKLSTDEIVDQWVRDHIMGSAIGRSTEAWNHLHAALEHLKDRLRQ